VPLAPPDVGVVPVEVMAVLVGCVEVAVVAVGCVAEAVVAVGATVVAVGSVPQAESSTALTVSSESAPNLVLRLFIVRFLHLFGYWGKADVPKGTRAAHFRPLVLTFYSYGGVVRKMAG
jgi:hypothetical protein